MNNGQKIKVAYADDNIIFRNAMVALLEHNGNITVNIKADNGSDLLNQLQETEPLPDVCLIDINMPVMNGFEVTPKIRKQWPGIGILAYSSWNDEYNTMQMISKGANGYMVKGYPIEDLIKAFNYVHQKGVFCAEAFADDYFYKLAKKGSELKIEMTNQEMDLLRHFSKFDITRLDLPLLTQMTESEFESIKMSLFEKLHVRSRTGLALYAIQTGLVAVDLS